MGGGFTMDKKDTDKIYEAQFMQLIMSLQSSAWMMLGKVMNPLTGKIEKNLDGAKTSIDTLMMLKEKTKGNLSKTEEDFLSNALQQLQLNYIDESKKHEAKEDNKKEEANETKEDNNPKDEKENIKDAKKEKKSKK